MLLKTKLLLSLGTLVASGGVGAGVYYIKNRKIDDTKKNPSSERGTEGSQSPAVDGGGTQPGVSPTAAP